MIIGIEASHASKSNRTGVEEVCYQIIEHLKNILSAEDKVILYSHKNLDGRLGMLPVNWQLKILPWKYKKLWTQFALSRELRKNPPDVFFAPGQLIPWRVPKNTVVYLHDSAFLATPKAYRFCGRVYLQLMNWWIARRARMIITSTEFNRDEFKKYYGEKVSEKVVVAPLAYDDVKYNIGVNKFSAEELRNRWQIAKPYLFFVGRLETKKNIIKIIEAFEKARNNIDIQLVLAGKPGYGYKDVECVLENSKFRDDIKVLGWVDDGDLARLLRTAEMLVFPSLYEGFGLPVLEAMAVGVPVVAGDIPALREVGGESPLYASPLNSDAIAQKILFILQNTSVRQVMVDKGLIRIKAFTWRKTAAQIAKFIQICYSNSVNKA